MATRARPLLRASRLALPVLALVPLFLVYMAVIRSGAQRAITDFDTFYASAQHALAGENPYLLLPGRGFVDDRILEERLPDRTAGTTLTNLNPPFFVAISAPVAVWYHGGWKDRVPMVTALGLTSIPPPRPPSEIGAPIDPTPLAWLEPRFVGLLLLFVLACWMLIRSREGRAPGAPDARDEGERLPTDLLDVARQPG